MIVNTACPPVVAIEGYFYAAAPNDGNDPTSDLVMLRHIPLGYGEPQITRFVSVILLLELIAGGEAVLVIGDHSERYDSEDADHHTVRGSVSMPRRHGGEPALKTEAYSARNLSGLLSFGQPAPRSAA